MDNYVLFTDSACDIPVPTLNEWGYKVIPLTLTFEGDGKEYNDYDIDSKEFYNRMRAGEHAKTAAINVETFEQAFRPVLQGGQDILYIAFSSGLSNTFNAGRLAAEELKNEFPERTVTVVDSLSASAGFGLLVYLAAQHKTAGESLAQVADFVTNTRLHLCHWFTVDDLKYLKRGGRISPTVAFVGGLLGIKPILHMDNEGHLINMTKVRGRKQSIKMLADKFGELAKDPHSGPVFICHGDCREDADQLAKFLREDYGVPVQMTVDVGPVIGSHSGPGTLSVFFLGRER